MIHRTTPDQAALHPSGWCALDATREITAVPLVDSAQLGLYARLSYADALAAARRFGASLISAADLATLRAFALPLEPVTINPDSNTIEASRNHDFRVGAALARAGWDQHQPVCGIGKWWLAGAPHGRAWLGGWWSHNLALYGPRRGAGWVQQPSSGLGPHNDQHFDYGTLTMLVRPRGVDEAIPDTDPAPPPIASAPRTCDGIDVSSNQSPSAFDWPRLAETLHFVIARACYGHTPDAHFREHIAGASAAGMTTGAYVFFRQQQPWLEQFAALKAACFGCDLVPAVDLEANAQWDGPLIPRAHNTAGRALVERVAAEYGRALIYTSPGHWLALGKPSWMLEHEIWTAHWGVSAPSWPSDYAIWQRSATWRHSGFARGALDLDYSEARRLPLIGL
jgi:GH25 family lysozyme M1 (1,4-beta-N-acetylmuramidase)